MKVIIAEKCGFCPGVRNAISMAEKALSKPPQSKDPAHNNVYSLGPIIHNKDMVQHLAKAGLKTVNTIDEIKSGTVIIRSHGACPETIAKLKEKGLNILDATCILVKRLQQIAEQLAKEGYQVIIIGDENHPEVKSVVGCVTRHTSGGQAHQVSNERKVIVVAQAVDLHKIPENGKLGVVCQTTCSPEHFASILAGIAKLKFRELKVINTLCKEAIARQESAVRLCKQVDIMFVLGDRESANTRTLAQLCKKYNPQTFHLQNWSEFDKNIIRALPIGKTGKNMVGVTAGASTPEWVITEFVENLSMLATYRANNNRQETGGKNSG